MYVLRMTWWTCNGLQLLPNITIWITASTCALTIGLNLCWTPNPEKFEAQHNVTLMLSKDDGEYIKAVMYLVAITWSMWSGTLVYYNGPYYIMTFGVIISIFGSVVVSITPMSIYWLYLARVLQGLGCASLTVAIPLYIVNSTKGLYQSEYYVYNFIHLQTGKSLKGNRTY